jgi:hypothetical protein
MQYLLTRSTVENVTLDFLLQHKRRQFFAFLFYFVCVPVRLGVAFLIYENYTPQTAWAVLLLLTLVGGGFANEKPGDRGIFLGVVYWPRDVHACLFLLAAYGLFCDTDASHVVFAALVVDVVLGVSWRWGTSQNRIPGTRILYSNTTPD